MIKRSAILLLIFTALIVMWLANKHTVNLIAFYQLLFLLLSMFFVLLFTFDKSANFLNKSLQKYPLVKFGIFCIVVIWGYNCLTGFTKILSSINIGKSLSTGLIEFFIIGLPLVGIFLLFYFISGIINLNSKNTNLFLFLFFLLFVLYGGALWMESSIPYVENTKSLILFSHLYYHILFFIALPLVVFSRCLDIKKVGFDFDIRSKDLWYFIVGISTIFFVHCMVRMSVGAFQIPSFSFFKWIYKIAYVTFIIALPEELLMRGIGIPVLEEKFSHSSNKTMIAIMVISILEALLHYRLNIFAMIFIALSGLMYGYLFVKTRKLIAPVLTHVLVDVLFAPYPF